MSNHYDAPRPVYFKLKQNVLGPSPHLVMEVDHHGGGVSLEQGYLSSRNMANSCGFPVDPSASSATGHFLGQSIEPL